MPTLTCRGFYWATHVTTATSNHFPLIFVFQEEEFKLKKELGDLSLAVASELKKKGTIDEASEKLVHYLNNWKVFRKVYVFKEEVKNRISVFKCNVLVTHLVSSTTFLSEIAFDIWKISFRRICTKNIDQLEKITHRRELQIFVVYQTPIM